MSLGAVLQENLLVLLAYDPARAPLIRNTVDVELYGGPYRDIAARVYDYIDKYKLPPKDHLADILEDKLGGNGKTNLYSDILISVNQLQETVNAEYVMTQLETFIKRQSLRSVAIELATALKADTEESLEVAEDLIRKASTARIKVFDPGTRLSDKAKSLGFLDVEDATFPTGIPELDKRGFGPNRKELWLGIADKKSGKTFMLSHLAKVALMNQLRVSHITLEMSEERISQRYMMALFAMAKRADPVSTTKLELDQYGRVKDFANKMVTPSLALDDPNIRAKLERRVDRWTASGRVLPNIIVKQFPTGSLTVRQLIAYLDNLKLTERFVPDLLIVDYPDLMKTDANNLRASLDEIFKDLRGIAVLRNLALAVVSQSNRQAANAKMVGAENVAEAYTKTQNADTVITYSQTKHEKRLGLARLNVVAGRNDQDAIEVVISQAYAFGQFVLSSGLRPFDYWSKVEPAEGDET